MILAEFEVGRDYQSDPLAPQITILARTDGEGATDVLFRTECGVEGCVEVMWCDLAKAEVVELPKPWDKACYPVVVGGQGGFR